jgi:hypothetical protein
MLYLSKSPHGVNPEEHHQLFDRLKNPIHSFIYLPSSQFITISRRPLSMLSCHLFLGIPSGRFQRSSSSNFCIYFSIPLRVTCWANSSLLGFIGCIPLMRYQMKLSKSQTLSSYNINHHATRHSTEPSAKINRSNYSRSVNTYRYIYSWNMNINRSIYSHNVSCTLDNEFVQATATQWIHHCHSS